MHNTTLQQLESTKVTFDENHSIFFDRFLAMRNDIVNHMEQYRESHRYCTLRDLYLDLDVAKPTSHLQMVRCLCFQSFSCAYLSH